MNLLESLKKNAFIRTINDMPILQKNLYNGTSGIGLLSKDIDTFINIYNSFYFHKNENIGLQKLIFSDGFDEEIVTIKLISNESKIIKLSDYFEPKVRLKIVSCRVYSENHPLYVPYFYSSVTCIKSKNTSVLHSSSFGNSLLKENALVNTERLFEKDTLLNSDLILLTLYKYKKNDLNNLEIIFKNKNNKIVTSFDVKFRGESCRVMLKNYISELSEKGLYRISIKGPVTTNPYIFFNSQTLFHI